MTKPDLLSKTCPTCGQQRDLTGIVRKIFADGREHTASEVREITLTQIRTNNKEIFNAVGGLVRRGEIVRLSHGRYVAAPPR
jgi:hypothetical protein